MNTKENPADLASRGCTVTQIVENEFWWKGPQWLQCPISEWPNSVNENCSEVNSESETMENMKREECESANLANREMKGKDTDPVRCAPFEMDISRYSTLLRLKRVTAWCLRFIDKMRHRNENHSDLKKEEFEKAELLWIKHTR